jgi:hypothetical protein
MIFNCQGNVVCFIKYSAYEQVGLHKCLHPANILLSSSSMGWNNDKADCMQINHHIWPLRCQYVE